MSKTRTGGNRNNENRSCYWGPKRYRAFLDIVKKFYGYSRKRWDCKKELITKSSHKPGFLPNFLADRGVEVIISGGMGGRAIDLFNERNINWGYSRRFRRCENCRRENISRVKLRQPVLSAMSTSIMARECGSKKAEARKQGKQRGRGFRFRLKQKLPSQHASPLSHSFQLDSTCLRNCKFHNVG